MKIGMMFPGYGSQFAGMTKELYDESRLVQEYFEEASNCLNVNFVKLCFASSDVELGQIPDAYTANFLASCALAALLKSEGIEPSGCVIDHQGQRQQSRCRQEADTERALAQPDKHRDGQRQGDEAKPYPRGKIVETL